MGFEIVIIFLVALVVLGPKKLPELARTLGKGMAEFRRASAELRGSLEREMQNIDEEVRREKAAQEITARPPESIAAAPALEAQPETHPDQYPDPSYDEHEIQR